MTKTTYDARGLAEPNLEAPNVAKVVDGQARFDAQDLSTRAINLELRRLVYGEGVTDITVENPSSKHSLGSGLLARCHVTFEGSVGYFGCTLLDGAEMHVQGRAGWSLGQNMMSGVVVVEKNAGSLTGAALRGGDLVVKGHVGGRTGIDQKGGTIIVGGNAGINTGFMMQRGRQIICGDANDGLGDSMYEGVIYVGGKVKSLGIDCIEAELDDDDEEFLNRKLSIYAMSRPDSFRKFVCGKKLWNYDSLEPSERRIVL